MRKKSFAAGNYFEVSYHTGLTFSGALIKMKTIFLGNQIGIDLTQKS
jgi:hypothetical protein